MHVGVEEVIEYVEGNAAPDARQGMETHFSTCSSCRDLLGEYELLLTQMNEDASFEPPAELVQWGINLFQPILQPAKETVGKKIKKFVAALVFDTYDEPMLDGVRRVGAPPRQLLFRSGDVDVDVKIESMEAEDRITLVGQVLSSGSSFFDNTPVKLESHGVVRFRTQTNLVGEFSFDEVPKDTYHLSVDLPEGQLTLFCVHRGNS